MNRSTGPAAAFALALTLAAAPCGNAPARGDVTLPAVFGDHMVLQQKQSDKVYGKADPGEEITVSIAGQSKAAKAGDDGRWSVGLDPIEAGGPHTLTVKGKNTVTFSDVLVGEVWLCSGQSNMEWQLSNVYDGDAEALSANIPEIRLISVPKVGTQEPQETFRGKWEVCTPQTARDFSAVGFFFGRQLQKTLGVPVGLIDDSWGGSAAEAWVRRDLLEKDETYKTLMERWEKIENDSGAADRYRESVAKAKAEGRPAPKGQNPQAQLTGNARPGNIYNGVLKPTIGYGIKGVIWYQGESNAGRAYQYRELFPLMIKSWRDEWGIGDFPFYWVQLADYRNEKAEPAESDWAELREAQTLTAAKLPHTGQAVIIDVGEGQDIHPRNKQTVARRLARLALAQDYGFKIPHHSPTYKAMEKKDGKIVVSFDHADGGLKAFDVPEPKGFAVAGADKKFVWAKAKVVGSNKDQVEVWSDEVSDPAAVRYAWADNPVCNLYTTGGLPVTPFRTDDWPGVTAENK